VTASGFAPSLLSVLIISTFPDCAALCTHVYPSPSLASTSAPCSARISNTAICPSTPPRQVAHRWFAA
jgi:hypothetical protein